MTRTSPISRPPEPTAWTDVCCPLIPALGISTYGLVSAAEAEKTGAPFFDDGFAA